MSLSVSLLSYQIYRFMNLSARLNFSHWPQNQYLLCNFEGPIVIRDRNSRVYEACDSYFLGTNMISIASPRQGTTLIMYTLSTKNPLLGQQDIMILDPEQPIYGTTITSLFSNQAAGGEALIAPFLEMITSESEKHILENRKKTGQIDPVFIKINRYIRTNCHLPLTLQSLSERFGYNPVYLSNKYTKVFGISPMRYLQNSRMTLASKQLLSDDVCVTELAHQIGFESVSQFGALFKRYFGLSPREFRVRHRIGKV